MRDTNPFETRAAEYDTWFDTHPAQFESELRTIRTLLPEQGGRWVEIGVGTGQFASQLGIELGVEPAAAMAARAEARGVRVVRGTAEDLPLGSGAFDVVFFITTLCFVSDVGRALAEARRVLAPGGLLIAGVLPREGKIGRQISSRSADAFLCLAKPLTLPELRALLATADFRVDCEASTLADPEAPERVEEPKAGSECGSFVVVRAVATPEPHESSMQS